MIMNIQDLALSNTNMSSKTDKMKKIRDELLEFKESPLYEYRKENGYFPVIGEGSHDAKVVFIGEAPGENEAKQGRPFCGASGRVLDELLLHIGLKRKDVYVTNVVKDRPQGNRDPKPEEIELYTPFLLRQIEIIEPSVIATLGRFAMQFVLDHFQNDAGTVSISKVHGTTIPLQTREGADVVLVPLYHPAVALYNGGQKVLLKHDFEVLKKFLYYWQEMPKNTSLPVWDLTQLYKSFEELDLHVAEIELVYKKFAKKYQRDTEYLTNPLALKKALDDREKISALEPSKPLSYLNMARDINTQDKEIESKLSLVQQKMTDLSNLVVFFDDALRQVSREKQKEFLKNDVLNQYHYFLKVFFDSAKYALSEKEEILLNKKSLTSYNLWVQGVEKAQSNLTISIKKRAVSFNEVLESLSNDMHVKERRVLWSKIIESLKTVAEFAESEINAVVLDKKIEDELRGFNGPYESTLLGYQNTSNEIEPLLNAVTHDFETSGKYYELKRRLLGIEKLEYVDRMAPLRKISPDFQFENAVTEFRESLIPVGQKYVDMFDEMLKKQRIDVEPRKGKRGGAYCSGHINMPTFVLLNHLPNLKSFETLAHEMGHAFHYELSKTQQPIYQHFTISVAEVASTFFENIAFYSVFEKLSEKDKVVALHNKLDGTIATIHRQIAFFNFELELHKKIRENGFLTHGEIAALFQKHLSTYMGKKVEMTQDDGYSFIYIPHFRSYFYVYAYAYGELISAALYRRYTQDPSYMKEIEKFLTAGGSKSPHDIFKDIGINTEDPRFWKEGLEQIRDDVKRFEKLANKTGMIT